MWKSHFWVLSDAVRDQGDLQQHGIGTGGQRLLPSQAGDRADKCSCHILREPEILTIFLVFFGC